MFINDCEHYYDNVHTATYTLIEAFASESQKDHEYMFHWYYYIHSDVFNYAIVSIVFTHIYNTPNKNYKKKKI